MSHPRNYKGLTYAVAVASACLLVSGTASADPITGLLFAGLGQVGVSAFGTDFYSYNNSGGQCDVPGSSPGCFEIQSNSSGIFSSYVGDSTSSNLIDDLSNPAEPLSGPLAVPDYISIDGGAPGGVTFDLTDIFAGTGANCFSFTDAQLAAPGTSCTIYVPYGPPFGTEISPYTLTNDNAPPFGNGNAETASVSMTMTYNAYTGNSSGGETPYYGIFTTDASFNILQILTAIEGGGELSSQWQATFAPIPVSSTPEPGSLLLVGLGLMAGGVCRFRGRRS